MALLFTPSPFSYALLLFGYNHFFVTMPQFLPSDESVDTITAVSEAPPGTELLYDAEGDNGIHSKRLHSLQHAKKGDSHILLVPQPSLTDPNDPLLWPTLKKWITFSNALFYSFLGAVTGPIMAAGK
jgi:hypothetical protein